MATATDPGVIDKIEGPEDFDRPVRRWTAEITAAERASDRQAWVKRGDAIIKRYRDHRDTLARQPAKFNILWSNTETMAPVVYSQEPKPQVDRRWLDDDDVGRLAAQVLERACKHTIETCDLDSTLEDCVQDYLLPGLACARVRYQPYMTTTEEGGEALAWEEAPITYTYWKDVLWSPARRWKDVTWVAFRIYCTKAKLKERFGKVLTAEDIENIPLDYREQIYTTSSGQATPGITKKAVVWEIWDLDERKVSWLAPSWTTKLLDSVDDPLKLEGFFPCPEPLRATSTTDTFIPVPDYVEYQDQALELDNLTMRINLLTRALRVVGIYDSSVDELQQLLDSGRQENRMIPVKNWPAIVEKGGLEGVVDFMPLEDVVKTLMELYDARERVKATLYEVTGLADVVRGATDPNETAEAQKLKGKWVGLRTGKRQKKVARFARDLVRLMAEIIAEHFNPATLRLVSGLKIPTREEQGIARQQIAAMTQQAAAQAGAAAAPGGAPPGSIPGPAAPAMGAPVPGGSSAAAPAPPPDIPDELKKASEGPAWEDVIAVLRSDKLRSFKISIETDSTVQADQESEQKGRTELVGAIGEFLEKAIPFGQQFPSLAPLIGELIMFVIRGWKVGRPLEQAFEDAMKQLTEAAKDAEKAPPKPDAVMIEAEAKAGLMAAQTEKTKAETAAAGGEAQTKQAEAAAAAAKAQGESVAEVAKINAERDAKIAEINSAHALAMREIEAKKEGEIEIQRLKLASAEEVARINAGSDLQQTIQQTVADTVAAALAADSQVRTATATAAATPTPAEKPAAAPSAPVQIMLGKDGGAVDLEKHTKAITDAIGQSAGKKRRQKIKLGPRNPDGSRDAEVTDQ